MQLVAWPGMGRRSLATCNAESIRAGFGKKAYVNFFLLKNSKYFTQNKCNIKFISKLTVYSLP